jgi:hypothetical protein
VFNTLQIGDKVYVISYSPFRGLRGTIRKVDHITSADMNELPFIFYEVDLEDAYIRESVWFQGEEVELISLS